MNFDHVFINNIELACRIGTFEEERAFPQILRVTVRIFLPLAKAGATDSLENTIDYADILQKIRARGQQRTYNLAEALAEDIAAIALAAPLSQAVEVEVKKKVFEGVDAVGAFLRREKKTA